MIITEEIMPANYVKTIYNVKDRPVTSYPNQLIRHIIALYRIRRGSIVLDSGSGRGDFSRAFAKAGMDTWGIDASDYEKKYEDGVNFVGNFDLETGRLPFDDGYFDVVFSKSVLEHIHKPEQYLSEINRVLKPGGLFIVMVPDWHTQMYIYYDDFSHVQPYTQKGLADALKVFGFKNVSAEVFYQLPIVWKHPSIKIVCMFLQFIGGPVKKISKNKFYRFSRELMIIGSARKSKK